MLKKTIRTNQLDMFITHLEDLLNPKDVLFKLSNTIPWEKFRKRAGIKPVIVHLKTDYRLGRNFLKGIKGDFINVLMASVAFNFKKWMREEAILFFLKNFYKNFYNILKKN